MPVDVMDELYRALGRLESKVDEALAHLPRHDTRISKLENRQAYMSGAIAMLFLAIGALGWLVTTLLSIRR